ncbi:hypothetical protein Maeo_1001 [Methanococcus aeolicus Nankai-3]|uniref:Transglutaminase domain protein n=1 Tax=Methanococcus aeolicus (strain ATCC BAA-1280 / DSM 17508 / OCM 812 / Nankai-3) TaxID=419665 RepID=A6UVQ7_META3|nr:hypothetical protein [Methanococcus aeolicus]ABR56579.1 hypothetical protein Maeo_1001 [Methanococcus aeolicus Nankai-3]
MKKLIYMVLLFITIIFAGCIDEPSLDDADAEKIVIKSGDIQYYSWNDDLNNTNIQFKIESNNPIDVFVIPSNELKNIKNDKDFKYYAELSRQNILSYNTRGLVPSNTIIVIVNNRDKDAQVSIKLLVVEPQDNENTLKTTIFKNTNNNNQLAELDLNTIYYTPYPLAFYNVFYELGEPDITYNITNNGKNPIIIRLTSEYQGYSNKAITTEIIMPNETDEINQTIPLIKDRIKQIKTKTKFNLHYIIEYNDNGEWKTYDEQTEMIDIYPMDTMVWAIKDSEGNEVPIYEYVTVFITPKDDAIMELLGIAKEYHPERSLAGYQYSGDDLEGWREYTDLQVKAIYDALKYGYGVSYVNTPTAYGKDTVQKVKLPKETLATSSGNCIDGAVLFASAIEALGMHPYIIVIPGHAFVAWDVDGSGNYIEALETTMVGNYDFEDALNRGNKELLENWDALTDDDPWNGQLINVKEGRELGILPME